jgi:predicted transcriptional regulator
MKKIFELSKQQQDRIAEARKEYANGDIVTHEEVKRN